MRRMCNILHAQDLRALAGCDGFEASLPGSASGSTMNHESAGRNFYSIRRQFSSLSGFWYPLSRNSCKRSPSNPLGPDVTGSARREQDRENQVNRQQPAAGNFYTTVASGTMLSCDG